jgi:hypothetical protein
MVIKGFEDPELLEQILAEFTAEELPATTKEICPQPVPSKEWTTAMVELRDRRPPQVSTSQDCETAKRGAVRETATWEVSRCP